MVTQGLRFLLADRAVEKAAPVVDQRQQRGDSYQAVVADREVRTRRGKRHVLRTDDPALRPARWWERWFWGNRFPALG